MGPALQEVAIIGAGLAGTALALALHEQNVACQIYESRASGDPELASGVVLTPNGIRVLDALGVFSRIKDRCWKAQYRTYKNDKDETIRKVLVASEAMYGYQNHRLWRRILLAELKLMLKERNMWINYESRFEGVVTEDEQGVTFRINTKEKHASLLVGADGIFSSVRRYLDSTIQAEYTGVIGAMAHIRTDGINWPYPDYEPQFTMQGKAGAFIVMPEDPKAEEIMIAKQIQRPESTRAEWDALAANKNELCEFFRRDYDQWHDTAKQIIDQVCKAKDSIFLWPFLRMPKLERWFSSLGKVIIIGDAAHALPPSSGQGVNQALEDAYSLALILARSPDIINSLGRWQVARQQRIDAVFEWATNSTNVQRMSEAERQQLIATGKIKDPNIDGDDMRWLYQLNLEKEMVDLLS